MHKSDNGQKCSTVVLMRKMKCGDVVPQSLWFVEVIDNGRIFTQLISFCEGHESPNATLVIMNF